MMRPTLGRYLNSLVLIDIPSGWTATAPPTPIAANYFVGVVRKMSNCGRATGKVPRELPNPAVGIVRFPQRKRRHFVTTVEMPRLLAAIETEDDDYARHALWLLLLTGLRLNEVLRSKWSDIDWDFRTLFIGLTKNGEPVPAPLSDAAIARLQQIPRLSNNEYIICGKKPGAHLVGLPHIRLRVRAAANLPDVRLHDLRRTVGSLVQRGESLHLVGQILNHRDTKTTAGYADFQTQHRERALTADGQAIMKFAPVSSAIAMTLAYEAPVTPQLPTSKGEDPARRAHYVSREVYIGLFGRRR